MAHATDEARDASRMKQFAVRLDPSLVARADELVDALTRRTGKLATRSDVLREALARGLTQLEIEAHGRHAR